MRSIFFIFSVFVCANFGCGTHKNNTIQDKISRNEIFSIGDECVFKTGQGIDSQVGTVSCGDVSLNYDYGRFSYPGPITLEEDFINGFKGVFHVKFLN
ncbi:MAG: hypothetical protein IPO92_24170 [Saprospiraceae bacterium]|nr:hypothetical protein [Saprospiraceae bacterium]